MLVPKLVLATGSIALLWLILAAALAGLGLWARRLFKGPALSIDDLFLSFWIGLCGVMALGTAWNFFLPIGPGPLILVFIAGGMGLFFERGQLWALFRQTEWRPSRRTMLLMGLGTLWLANLALAKNDYWDSALYHIQAIKWANSYAVAPGLANLYGPLGFNNYIFFYDAVLNVGPLASHASHFSHGLLLLILGLQGGLALSRLAAGRTNAHLLLEGFFLIIPTSMALLESAACSFSTDPPVNAVLLVVLSLLVRILETERSEDQRYYLIMLSTLISAGVAIKLSAAILGASLWLLALVTLWREGALRKAKRTLIAAIGIPSLAASMLVARSIIVSGYPFFPKTLLGLNVDWRAPIEHGDAEYAYIVHSGRATARLVGVVPDIDSWLVWPKYWAVSIYENPYNFVVPVSVGVLAFGRLLMLRKSALTIERPAALPWLHLPLWLGVLFWLTSAPATRYVMFMFWAIVFLFVVEVFHREKATTRTRLVQLLIALNLSVPIFAPIWRAVHRDFGLLATYRSLLVKRPGKAGLFQDMYRDHELIEYKTKTGLVLNVPYKRGGRCFDAALPCTPNPAQNLRLRNPGQISSGFRVDGEWAMEYWPYAWAPKFLDGWRAIEARK